MTDRWTRLAPLTGVVFVALIVIGPIVLSGSTPGSDESGVKVLQFYKDHQNAQRIANIVGALGVVFFVFFAGTLRVHLRNAGQEGLAAVGFGGGILFAVGGALFAALGFALADAPGKLDPSGAVLLNVLSDDIFFPSATGASVFMIAGAIAIIRSRALPIWLGWAAVPIGVVAVTPLGFFAFLATLAWSLATAILLYQRGAQPAMARAA